MYTWRSILTEVSLGDTHGETVNADNGQDNNNNNTKNLAENEIFHWRLVASDYQSLVTCCQVAMETAKELLVLSWSWSLKVQGISNWRTVRKYNFLIPMNSWGLFYYATSRPILFAIGVVWLFLLYTVRINVQ